MDRCFAAPGLLVLSWVCPLIVQASEVTRFVLVDAATDSDIGPLQHNDVIDLSSVGSSLNIRAEVSGSVESVRFGLDANPNYRIENESPYALAGDSGTPTNYNVWSPDIGTHTLSATPYAEDAAQGNSGESLTIQFTVVDTPPEVLNVGIANLLLYDARTDVVVGALQDQDTIDRSERAFNVEAVLDGQDLDHVGSVVFEVNDAEFSIDSRSPYTFGGDDQGDYWPLLGASEGTYDIRATPFEFSDGTGRAGQSLALTVYVVRSASPDTTPPTAPGDLKASNVTSEAVNLVWTPSQDDQSGVYDYVLYRRTAGGKPIPLAHTSLSQYADTAVQPATSYEYTVVARNYEGLYSETSNVIDVETDRAPAPQRWSDPASWSSNEVPKLGDDVVIPEDTAMLLDVSPPELDSLTIHGSLTFDDRDLDLAAGWILIEGDGGSLNIGSQDVPYANKATITLTAEDEALNVLPTLGNKFLIVRNEGQLHLHGHRRDAVSWTQLAEDAAAGQSSIVLSLDKYGRSVSEEPQPWRVDDEIIIAPSGTNPMEGEKVTITAVSGNIVHFTPALQYDHLGSIYTHHYQDGNGQSHSVDLDMRAEVGLLTRDIVIQGTLDETDASFGGHTLTAALGQSQIEGVEFFRMGQTKIQGRYPVHWHFAGDLIDNYARNNSVHDSLHRAFVTHGTCNVLVEDNVSYNIKDHAHVIAEDGNEQNNIHQGNLIVQVVKLHPWFPGDPAEYERAFGCQDCTQDDSDGHSPTIGGSTQEEGKPACGWGVNYNNAFRNNHCAGVVRGNGLVIGGVPKISEAIVFGELVQFNVSPPVDYYSNNVIHSIAAGDDGDLYELGFNRSTYRAYGYGVFVGAATPIDGGRVVLADNLIYNTKLGGFWVEDESTVVGENIVANSGSGVNIGRSTVNGLLFIKETDNNIGFTPIDYGCINAFSHTENAKDFNVEQMTCIDSVGPAVNWDENFEHRNFVAGIDTTIDDLELINPQGVLFRFERDDIKGAVRDARGALTGAPSYIFSRNFDYTTPACYDDQAMNAIICPLNDYNALSIRSEYPDFGKIGDIELLERSSARLLPTWTKDWWPDYRPYANHERNAHLKVGQSFSLEFVNEPVPQKFMIELRGSTGIGNVFTIQFPAGVTEVIVMRAGGTPIASVSSPEDVTADLTTYFYDTLETTLYVSLRVDDQNPVTALNIEH